MLKTFVSMAHHERQIHVARRSTKATGVALAAQPQRIRLIQPCGIW